MHHTTNSREPTPPPNLMAAGEPLLGLLEARLRLTINGGTHVKGTICIGVRRSGSVRWWVAKLGKSTVTYFSDALPAEYDAGVLVDGATAAWVLGSEPSPGSLHLVTGDQKLLEQFLRLHVAHLTPLGLRLGGKR